jgi:signal transduction histidine kinase
VETQLLLTIRANRSKLESGNAEIFLERDDLQETLDDVVHMIKRNELTKSKKLNVQTFYDPALPQFIEADSRRTQQILTYLEMP